jgi:hypothetical protein
MINLHRKTEQNPGLFHSNQTLSVLIFWDSTPVSFLRQESKAMNKCLDLGMISSKLGFGGNARRVYTEKLSGE